MNKVYTHDGEHYQQDRQCKQLFRRPGTQQILLHMRIRRSALVAPQTWIAVVWTLHM